MVEVQDTGFTRLGQEDPEDQYRINIVFVHGLGGHPKKTWGKGPGGKKRAYDSSADDPADVNDALHDDQVSAKRRSRFPLPFRPRQNTAPAPRDDSEGSVNKPFWPHEYIPGDIPSARVWTYGYSSKPVGKVLEANSKVGFLGHGNNLAEQLPRYVNNSDPIIFVAHSLGGIIVKRALCQSQPLQLRTKAIVFYGVPHRGSRYAKLGDRASGWAGLALLDANKALLRGLEVDSELLEHTHQEFRTIATGHGIKVHSFQEARGLSGIMGFKEKVVENYSSKVELENGLESVETIDADHKEMVKCSGRTDARYQNSLSVLKHLVSVGKLIDSVGSGDETSPIPPALQPREIVGSAAPSFKPFFHVPRKLNRGFVQRTSAVGSLNKLFFGEDLSEQTEAVALYGLGGMGKSQVALSFAQLMKQKKSGWSVVWLPAANMSVFGQECAQLLGAIGRYGSKDDDPKDLMRSYFSSESSGKWLLIVDNADDMDVLQSSQQQPAGLLKFLPQTSHYRRILFTTRYKNVAVTIAGKNVLELQKMTLQESRSLLGKALIQREEAWDESAVIELLRKLTCLPLAIAQAAAYINMNSISIAKYVQICNETKADLRQLLESGIQDGAYYDSSQGAVATTWLVSFDKIRETEPLASKMLSFMAWTEPTSIPESMLPQEGTMQQKAAALGTLRGYGFLQVREEDGMFDMHSLVQLMMQSWHEKRGDLEDSKAQALRHINKISPKPVWENRALWQLYTTHMLSIFHSCRAVDVWEWRTLGYNLGESLRSVGRARQTIGILEQVVATEDSLAEDDPRRLALQHALAEAYDDNGQITESVQLFEHVVAVKDSLAEDDPSRLASQHALAVAYIANGQITESVQLLEHVVTMKVLLPEDDPSRLVSQHALAASYHSNGQVKKAIQLLEHVVALEASLAENDPSRLASQQALAAAYIANGQITESVQLLEHVVAMEASLLSKEHPDRLASQHTLARAYHINGQVKKAIQLLEHIVTLEASFSSKEHPERLASQHELAGAYHTNGQVEKAIQLLEHIVTLKASLLSKEHPSRLASQHQLAAAYHTNGRIQEAIQLLEHIVAIRTTSLGTDHPDRLASQHQLAAAYHTNGRIQEAISLLEHVVAIRKTSLLEDHPNQVQSEGLLETWVEEVAKSSVDTS